MSQTQILVIDDEDLIGKWCRKVLEKEGYRVESFTRAADALPLLEGGAYDLVITDLMMPEIDGMEVIRRVKELSPGTDTVVITGFASIDSAVEAIRLGAYDYITKPFQGDDLLQKVRKCLERKRLTAEVGNLKEIVSLYEASRAMNPYLGVRQLLEMILRLACRMQGADAGFILLFDEKQHGPVVSSALNISETVVRAQSSELVVRCARAMEEAAETCAVLGGSDREPLLSELDPAARSALMASLETNLSSIGIIVLVRRGEAVFAAKDARLLSLFARNAAAVIKDAQVHERMRELDRMKSEFISNVSHELRTPLTSMRGALDLLQNGVGGTLNEKGMTLLKIHERNTLRMNALIDELLDFAAIEGGGMKTAKQKLAPSGILQEALEELRQEAARKEIALSCEIEAADRCVDADPGRLKQLFLNLIGNAVKFVAPGGRIRVSQRLDEKGELLVTVEDSGIGIPRDLHERVFEKFFRVDASSTSAQGGFGLGLAICKAIVQEHRGRIWVDSAPGKGSKFFVTLPLCT